MPGGHEGLGSYFYPDLLSQSIYACSGIGFQTFSGNANCVKSQGIFEGKVLQDRRAFFVEVA